MLCVVIRTAEKTKRGEIFTFIKFCNLSNIPTGVVTKEITLRLVGETLLRRSSYLSQITLAVLEVENNTLAKELRVIEHSVKYK